MTATVILALLAAAIVLLLVWMLRGAVLLPVKPGRRQTLTLVLRSAESGARLENTVRGLLWIIENGTLPATVVIEDAGLDEEAAKTARLLEKQYACVRIRKAEEEQHEWENRNT